MVELVEIAGRRSDHLWQVCAATQTCNDHLEDKAPSRPRIYFLFQRSQAALRDYSEEAADNTEQKQSSEAYRHPKHPQAPTAPVLRYGRVSGLEEKMGYTILS
ncbi:unnamed protein product [Fusarium langsethiae]|nr:unnamed protein product [Fusarium langsethiae]